MFSHDRNSAKMYARIGVETAVDSASPHKLILMLLEGALLSVSSASGLMREKRTEEKGAAISKAIDIIANGLKLSLVNTGTDSSIRGQLESLYDYMTARLMHANQYNDLSALDEVSGLLGDIKSAWDGIADDPAVLATVRRAA